MANGFWRVPVAAEVDALQGKVSGEKRLVPGRETQQCTIVANTSQDTGLPCLGLAADAGNQRFFREWQNEINISGALRMEHSAFQADFKSFNLNALDIRLPKT